MRFVCYALDNTPKLAVSRNDELIDLGAGDLGEHLASDPQALLDRARAASGAPLKKEGLRILPPILRPPKIICVGLNYHDHAAESPYKKAPDYPAFFPRFTSSLIGDGEAIVRPKASEQLDYEGELVAVIGRGGRHIPRAQALDHVFGYSIFNDASLRDYQFKSSQWTVGKNFDATGPFGPMVVTSDELPAGCEGLALETRLNGKVMQTGNISDLIFPVDELVHVASEVMTLEAGDIIVTGTPAGVGFARTPPIYMRDRDVCEVEIERIGVLRNPIRNEVA